MLNFEIEYTTNRADRLTTVLSAKNLTDAYLAFTFAHPIEYIITDIKEI